MNKISALTVLALICHLSFAQVDSLKQEVQTLTPLTFTLDDLDEDSKDQNASSLLFSNPDAFLQAAAYTFGPARFRVRGLDNSYSSLYVMGSELNDAETGRMAYGVIGGLNDAFRNRQVGLTMDYFDYNIGNLGGINNIMTRASDFSKGTKFTYSSANRTYRNRLMFITSTGINDKGWAFTASGSRRWSQEGYVDATPYDAWSYFVAVEKKLNDQHSLNLSVFGAPTERGRTGPATQEVFDLVGSNYYNPYWGYQEGKKRNSRMNKSHEPVFLLTHFWDIAEGHKIETTLKYRTGHNGYTALNWYQATDPRPDYYRNLPSYYSEDDFMANRLTEEWTNNASTIGQIDWANLYRVNMQNETTIENVGGIDGNDVTGKMSHYVIEERRTDVTDVSGNMRYLGEISEHLNLTSGIQYRYYKGNHYNLVDDLLGGEYFLDRDNFAERDFTDPEKSYNDLNNPNRVVKEGDRYGHDYDANVRYGDLWAQLQYKEGSLNAYLGAKVSFTNLWRTGNYRKGLFPDGNDSYGDSEKFNFSNIGLKVGATYYLTGRHLFSANAMYSTKAPTFQNTFVSPRTRNQAVSDIQSVTSYGGDLSYIIKLPNLTGRITGYYAKIEDQSKVISFYHDGENNFVNYILQGLDQQHMGMEIGLEYKITSELSVNAAANMGQYIYTSRPTFTGFIDNSQESTGDPQTVYYKNFHVSGTPQQTYTLGLEYWSQKYWWVGVNGNFFADNYIEANPVRRTTAAVQGLDPIDDAEQIHAIIDQERLPEAFTMDLFAGKSWAIDRKYYISLSLNVNNLLNNTEFITGGFEQYRYDFADQNPEKFPRKYYYFYGANYFLNASFRF